MIASAGAEIEALIYETGLAPELIGEDVGLSVVLVRHDGAPTFDVYQRRPSRVYGDRPAVIGSGYGPSLCRVLRRSVTVPFIHRLDFIRRELKGKGREAK
jgi:hypothetical protein